LLQKRLDRPMGSRKSDWIFVGAVLGLLFLIVCGGMLVSIFVLQEISKLLDG
jgi:hypothetical protein